MTEQTYTAFENGAVIAVPLNRLKKSPRNARRVPHSEAEIEALAASIAAKGVLQAPVDSEGAPTGVFLVTIGEGRRLALLALAKRKAIKKKRGFGAEEIAARFGVSAQVVRQRLRLGAVSRKLMDLYRTGELNLDQMMAFAISEDHARQEQVLEQLGAHLPPYLIRRPRPARGLYWRIS
jgi:ParB family transcriptional regulator, chromosome partitioning protein